MKKVLVGISAIIFAASTVALWNLNHGVMAFLNFVISGVLIGVAIGLLFDKSQDVGNRAIIPAVIAAVISVAFLVKNSTDYEVEKANDRAAVVSKEKARVDAMTPEQRAKAAFDAERTFYGLMLTQKIKASAFDPDALKIKSPEYFKNGVCVSANGKNRFGAYVGWKEYCYLVSDNGVWTLQE